VSRGFDHKIWGIGDHYQKKRGMFFEISYLLLTGRTEVLDSAADPAVPRHLLTPVRYIRAQVGQPFQGGATRNMPLLP
jgi:hypothetical protein